MEKILKGAAAIFVSAVMTGVCGAQTIAYNSVRGLLAKSEDGGRADSEYRVTYPTSAHSYSAGKACAREHAPHAASSESVGITDLTSGGQAKTKKGANAAQSGLKPHKKGEKVGTMYARAKKEKEKKDNVKKDSTAAVASIATADSAESVKVPVNIYAGAVTAKDSARARKDSTKEARRLRKAEKFPARAQHEIHKATWDECTTTCRNFGYGLKMGVAFGGTSPMPLPEEIRGIRSFGVNGCFMEEIYGYYLFNQRWGLYLGQRMAVEGMSTAAEVKNYYMSIEQDGEEMSGNYTGVDETNSRIFSMKVPLKCVCRVHPRWTLNFGPYVQFNLKKSFEGSVYDGYIRIGDPTGNKIEFDAMTEATYDFSDKMRDVLWGLELGADLKILKYFGAFAHLDWGMNSIFPSDFETIKFKMYPIYFSIGLFVGI